MRKVVVGTFLSLDGVMQAPGSPEEDTEGGFKYAFPIAIGSRARFLNLHTPGGFERYVRELTAMRSGGEHPDADFLRSHDIYEV